MAAHWETCEGGVAEAQELRKAFRWVLGMQEERVAEDVLSCRHGMGRRAAADVEVRIEVRAVRGLPESGGRVLKGAHEDKRAFRYNPLGDDGQRGADDDAC